MTAATGKAMAMRLDIARPALKLDLVPRPFTPLPSLAAIDGDIVVEGLAAPDTRDREFMKFSSACWLRRRRDIPLLFRHQPGRIAGEILDIEARYEGLFIRARLSDPEAKRCSYFSVAATIKDYELRQVDDPQNAHALITACDLDEVSITPDPVNPDAMFHPMPARIQFYNLAIDGVKNLQRQLEILQKTLTTPVPATPARTMRDPQAPRIEPRPAFAVPHRATPFGFLVSQIERNHPL